MHKIIRLLSEAFGALALYRNPWTYFKERLGWFKDTTICIALRNGLRYRIHTNTSDVRILNELWHVGIYDRLRRFVHENAVVVDIGAHVGVFAVKAASWGNNVRVYAYEPMPHNFDLLKENVALNGLGGRVKTFPHAVADARGRRSLYVRHHDSGGGSLYKKDNASRGFTVEVETVTLEDVFRENNIQTCDFMKVDCEGGEVPILTAAPRELLSRIRSLSIEWHDDLAPMPREQFMSFLRAQGYAVTFDAPTTTLYAARE